MRKRFFGGGRGIKLVWKMWVRGDKVKGRGRGFWGGVWKGKNGKRELRMEEMCGGRWGMLGLYWVELESCVWVERNWG